MKLLPVIFWSCGLVCLFAADPHAFHPFNEADLAFGKEDLETRLKEETAYTEKSIKDLRSIMMFANYPEQHRAAKALVQLGDQETILRVIFGLKQGNPWAEEILKSSPSPQIIAFLMEEVANGSMIEFGEKWPSSTFGKIRFAATEIVADTLKSIDNLPEPTREWLEHVSFGNGDKDIDDLSQKSKFLVEWWILNERAFLAGRWDELVPVPNSGSYPPRPKLPPPLGDDGWVPPPVDQPKAPWEFKPLEVSESFKDWSARIVHPERRDLRWVKLTFENDKWVEHPPARLDPLAPPTAPSRIVRRPEPPIAAAEHDRRNPSLLWLAGLTILASAVIWWLIRKPKLG